MGVSTDGIICCGLAFDEGCEFPWSHNGKHGQDELEAWWEVRGEKQELPIEMVNYCSDGVPMYVVAIKGSRIECGRGYPVEVDKNLLTIKQQAWQDYMEFVNKHFSDGVWKELNVDVHAAHKDPKAAKPTWLLCSYWGV